MSLMPGRTARIFFASVAAYNIATMAIWLQPAILGDYVANWGLKASSAGLVVSAEMATMAIAMLVVSRVAPAIRFLPAILTGMALTLVGTAGCLFVEQFAALIALRVVVALGFSLLMLVPTMALAGLSQPQTLYGRMYTLNLICSSGLLGLLSWIAAVLGARPGFKALLLYGALLLPLTFLMPCDAGTQARSATADQEPVTRGGGNVLLLAGGISILSMAYFAIWAFFLLFAGQSGLNAGQANMATAGCLLAAVAGTLLSPYFGQAVGNRMEIPLATILVTTGLLIVILSHQPALFVLAGCLALLTYYLLFPAVLGASAALDPSGKGAALINGSVVLLSAVGPYLGGLIMTRAGTNAFVVLALAASGVSLLLFAWFARPPRREHPLTSTQ